MQGFMNVVSSLLLLVSVGRLLYVMRKPPLQRNDTPTQATAASQWLLQQQQEQQQQQKQQQGIPPDNEPDTQPDTRVRGDRASEAAPVLSSEQEKPELALTVDRHFAQMAASLTGYNGMQSSHGGAEGEEGDLKWGARLKGRVLVFTMDSLADRVALAARGGPAGEIKVRESLTASLLEAGVEVGTQHEGLYLCLSACRCMHCIVRTRRRPAHVCPHGKRTAVCFFPTLFRVCGCQVERSVLRMDGPLSNRVLF